ncbi:MAG: antitoxin Xre/MbcA/ParS toxin-binding domain-containing protein [Ignavibacteriaceae bacterium]
MTKDSNSYASGSPVGKIKEINERYALTLSDIADILDVAPKTLTRWAKNINSSKMISKGKSDSLDILESILELGEEVLGSEEELNSWLHSSVFALDGNKPVDLIKTESGRRKVESALHQIEYGIF